MKPVLLVEDTDTDILLMRHVWCNAGVPNPLFAVEDGQSAIDYLAGLGRFADRLAHPLPCLVLLDLKIPYFSGHEVLQWIRQRATLNTLPVIILTSSSSDEDISRAYRLGANAYLEKPMGMTRLKELVTHLCGFWLNFNRFPSDSSVAVNSRAM
jgi:CheY-like chemotaxis protein